MTLRTPLPQFLLIGNGFTDRHVADRILEAVNAGVQWVQLRDHAARERTFLKAAEHLVDAIRSVRPDTLISINTRLTVAENLSCALHVGHRGPAPEDARPLVPPGLPIGLSIHHRNELPRQSVDYLLFSPVFETDSKPGVPGTGTSALAATVERAGSVPVMALGGVTTNRVEACLTAGAYGVAVLSGIVNAPDVPRAVETYLSTIEQLTLR